MSTKEKAFYIFNQLTEEQLAAFVTLFGGMSSIIDDEAEDDAICQKMLDDYLNDPDPTKNESMSLEEFATELGINLNDL